jgi:Uma2 family endonuclease
MVNPTETHEQIASNIGAPLKLAMDRRGCRTYQGGMRVQMDDDSGARDKFRPDLLARCGAGQNKTYVTDPIVLVEVLSPSTIDNDRGRKLRFYKDMPTARHIVLAYSDQMRVEHDARMPDGWKLTVLTSPEETLALDAIAFRIDLRQIYFDLPF